MTKREFLVHKKRSLSHLPRKERKERLAFYGEMIDDRMEEGCSEEEAVRAISEVEEPVEAPQKRGIRPWELVLLILGAPLWGSLLIAAAAVVLSVYVSLWAVVISLWAAEAALWVGGLGLLVSGVALATRGAMPAVGFLVGAALVCAGLSVFLFFCCKAASKGMVWMTRQILTRRKHHEI